MADVREVLLALGEESYYGVSLIELMPAPGADDRLVFGKLVGPGHIVLYDQQRSPWRLAFPIGRREAAQMKAAGAEIDVSGAINWPAGTLRKFVLGYVLTHELGHHRLQHERRLKGERAARTSEHEARAETIAARLRTLLP